MSNGSTTYVQERWRAAEIYAVCLRDNLTETETIDYFKALRVSDEMLAEVTGLDPKQRVFVKREDPAEVLAVWCTENVGSEMTAPEMGESMGMSVSAIHKRIRENPGAFSKVRRGVYLVRDEAAERAAAKAAA